MLERIEFKLILTLIGLIMVASGAMWIEFFPLGGVLTALAGIAVVVTAWL